MPARSRATFLFVVLMCTVMCTVMSFAMTIVNHGLHDGFFRVWTRSGLIGFLVALPTALLVVPPLRRVADRLAG